MTTLETLGPGRIFGAISALEQETYPASAGGVTAGAAWCLPRQVLLQLLALTRATDRVLAARARGLFSRRLLTVS